MTSTQVSDKEIEKLKELHRDMKYFLLHDLLHDSDIPIEIDDKVSEFIDRLSDIHYEMEKGDY
jgi:hypothetical protein